MAEKLATKQSTTKLQFTAALYEKKEHQALSSKLTKYSKFLSYVLRHKPESIGIVLDENGWVEVSVLLEASQAAGQNISNDLLLEIVGKNDKKRFAFNESGSRIRASQGHSVRGIDLEMEQIEPPVILYHGTVEKFMEGIEKSGLQKMNRQHVHLLETLATAKSVASRREKPIILEVQASAMHNAGYKFYRSENGVWLTDSVPWEYIGQERV